jgi:hypothetical protein
MFNTKYVKFMKMRFARAKEMQVCTKSYQCTGYCNLIKNYEITYLRIVVE